MRAVLLVLALCFLAAPRTAQAGVLDDWTEAASACGAAARQSAPSQARSMAMVHLAMFEAINGRDGLYTSYLGPLPVADPPLREVAASAAAHDVLLAQFPDQKARLDALLAKSGAGADPAARSASLEAGKRLGAAVVAARSNDGSAAPDLVRPVTSPGVYIATTLPAGSTYAELRPWFMASPRQFRPAPPPALSSAVWARDYEEIRAVGGKGSARRSATQTEVAKFWTIVGPPSWMPVARDLASRPGRTLAQNARLYALLSLALADSYIAVFDAKYAYNFWRPVTAIRNGDRDGNDATTREAGWEPLVETPMHPEYPCAHCVNSSTVVAVLESEFGAGPIGAFRMSSPALPGVTHSWEQLSDYAAEVANARIWEGVHYRNSTLVGAAMGRQIGLLAAANVLKKR